MSIRKGNLVIAGTPDLSGYQTVGNLSQTIDESTTKYPSNAAVKNAIDAKDSLPPQSETTDMQFLASKYDDTTGTSVALWSDVPTDPLFAFQFADHYLNDASWLRADTFSWQSGALYKAAYEHLVEDVNGITASTETINGITITYYRANDKHKIVLADQEANIELLFNSTGVAWYYILDTTNQRFKLPRTTYGVVGTDGSTDVVGNNVGQVIAGTDISGTMQFLYFYVGNTTRSSKEIDTGAILEKLPDYVDKTVASDRNIANWSSNVTNCITEIPQDIKLELSDGVLTLKAGSKVYVPNGFEEDGVTKKFDVYIVPSDLVTGATSLSSAERFVALRSGNIQIGVWSQFTSGTTVPSTGYFYHTSENRMYADGNVVSLSLPFMFGDYVQNSGFSSIDQVFNGFGYVGNTIFALPGVKGRIPNGRNADGNLNNIEFMVSKVLTNQTLAGLTRIYGLSQNTLGRNIDYVYDKRTNLNHVNTIDAQIAYEVPVITVVTDSNNTITLFSPKTTFQAVDHNDSSWIASQGMPSGKYIDLTLGANGSSYIAPANGWFMISSQGWTAMDMHNISAGQMGTVFAVRSDAFARDTVEAKKGQSIGVFYAGTPTNTVFRFIYAEGDN